jgi:hypothetical protein
MEYVLQTPLFSDESSFPHAFSGSATRLWTDPSFGGNPGEIRTGPPIKTFGGDGLRSRISSPQRQFSKKHTKNKLKEKFFPLFVLFVSFAVRD